MNNMLRRYYELYKEDWGKAKKEIDDYYTDFNERLDVICDLMYELDEKEQQIEEQNKRINDSIELLRQKQNSLGVIETVSDVIDILKGSDKK